MSGGSTRAGSGLIMTGGGVGGPSGAGGRGCWMSEVTS